MKLPPKLKRLYDEVFTVVMMLLFAWFAISTLVFKMRHPWATEMEVMLNIHNAVQFKKVSYETMRPRDF